MSYHPDDTICAIATGPGGAAKGIVRVSGRDAVAIVAALFEPQDGSSILRLCRATAISGSVRVPLDDSERTAATSPITSSIQAIEATVPCDLFVWPNQRSYTREPIIELHTIGSIPILEAAVAAICRRGARLAEPGEFTLRAFLAGRIDLTQAEAVLGVIDARRPDELKTALAQLAGGLARPLQTIRDDLLQLLAELEAGLDFVEDDIQFVSHQDILTRLDLAAGLLADVSRQMSVRHRAAETHQIALVGPPNVGKSSLFNALVKRYGIARSTNQLPVPDALVSAQRGTTRDYLTATISLGELNCQLLDTAGLDRFEIDAQTNEVSPAQGKVDGAPGIEINDSAQAAATAWADHAAVLAICVDAGRFMERAAAVEGATLSGSGRTVLVLTKSDLLATPIRLPGFNTGAPVVLTSSRTGEGLDALRTALRTILMAEPVARCESVVESTANRCRQSARLAETALANAKAIAERDGGHELVAAEIGMALNELGKVVGAVYTDDLLDRIFSTFCIGK